MNKEKPVFIHQGLDRFLAAGRSLIMVRTFEEDRLENLLRNLSVHHRLPYWTWSVSEGLKSPEGLLSPETHEPELALRTLLRVEEPRIVWLKDVHHHYSPQVLRLLRDLYYRWREIGAMAVVSATTRAVPADLEREMAYLLLDMPGQQELLEEVTGWLSKMENPPEVPAKIMSATLKGLTISETRHALTRLKNQKPDASQVLRTLQEEKRLLISRTGTLEYVPDVPNLSEMGGLENLKDWLLKRKELLTTDDQSLKEIAPKGVLLMGVSGCGKSLCIKAISSAWQLPLYRMEMVKIFSGAYGSPELAFADACRLMEEMAPAVLWIDEIEMSLSAEGSTAADSVLSRIFAFFLTWMQEKPPGLFVAATANRIDLLPAEMIRKGRFDQVFFVDLPVAGEREQIFKIHLQKRGYNPASFTPEVFADATDGWSGAEIEQCVIAAVTSARMENRDLVLKDLYAARKQIVPISTTMEEQVRHIRNWAYERAVRASAEG